MLFLSSQDLVFVPCSESINHAWCNPLLNIRLRGSVDVACARNRNEDRTGREWGVVSRGGGGGHRLHVTAVS
jgi:hypothetical protein